MSQYIKSPLNYAGGKYKILEHIIPSFPKTISNFVDLFAGGLNVGINIDAGTIYANDQITYLIELYRFFQNTETNALLASVRERIDRFGLSQTNTAGYNVLRSEYNETGSSLDLFVLLCYSFNHQLRFNGRHEFNTPFGKERSSFNGSIERNLIMFCEALHRKNFVFSSCDFRKFDYSHLDRGDVVYCDPPYLITTGSYNDGKRGFSSWTAEEDNALMEILDRLNSRGILFALSNVFVHKGRKNGALIEWSRKYFVNYIDKTYENCSYHLKDRGATTTEVLITNYKWNDPKGEKPAPQL